MILKKQPPQPQITKQTPEHEDKDTITGILKELDGWADDAEHGAHAVSAYALKRGFRRISVRAILELEPTLNKIGNLQGMVTSAKLRTIFTKTRLYGERAGLVGTVLKFGEQLWEDRVDIQHLVADDVSTHDRLIKTRDIASSVAARLVAGFVTGNVGIGFWIDKHVFGLDMTHADELLLHVETRIHEVTTPESINKRYLWLETKILPEDPSPHPLRITVPVGSRAR